MIDFILFLALLIFTSVNYLYYFQLSGYEAKQYIKVFAKENRCISIFSTAVFITTITFFLCKINLATMIVIYCYGFVLFSFGVYFLLKSRKIYMKFTPRIIRLLITVSILLFGILVPFLFADVYFSPIFCLVCAFFPLIVILANFINSPMEYLIKQKYIMQAVKKLEKINPIVVAVTGSYGKTSVKNIIGEILGVAMKTYCSPHSYNTPMGMCRAIENMPEDTKIFVAEFGARKKGDIAELCEMVKPTLGVIVGINNQHIESFGSIENTANTKCELTEYLAERNCITIVGAEGENAELLIRCVKSSMICVLSDMNSADSIEKFGLTYGKTIKSYIAVSGYKNDEFGSLFNIKITGEKRHTKEEITNLRSKIIGSHNAFNIAVGIAVGKQFGLTHDEIMRGVVNTKSIPHRLEIINNGGLVIIDDTYNSNKNGFCAALNILKSYNNSGKKVLLTSGIVELGKMQYQTNFDMCALIKESAEIVIIVGQTNKQAFVDGLEKAMFDAEHLYLVKNLDEAQKLFSTILTRGDCILMENDLPDNYK